MKLTFKGPRRHPVKLIVPYLLMGGLGAFEPGCTADDEARQPSPQSQGEAGNRGSTQPPENAAEGGSANTEPSDPSGIAKLNPNDSEPETPDANEPRPPKDVEGLGQVMEEPSSANHDEPGEAGDPDSTARDGAIEWIDRFWVVDSPTVSFNYGTTIHIDVAAAVKIVAQEKLIAFIETHSSLFTDAQYQALTKHVYFTERGYGSGLLLGILGLVLEDDFDYFRSNPSARMRADTDAEAKFLEALSSLEEEEYTLQGSQGAAATSPVPVRPRFLARVARLVFPNGKVLRALDTRLTVTDLNGGTGAVGLKDQYPLVLVSKQAEQEPLKVGHGYGVVTSGTDALAGGESVTLQIAKEVKCVSHDSLIGWVTEHARLFTDPQKSAITSAAAFADETATPELLLGILGVKLGGSFQFFSQVSSIQIASYTPADQEFVTALSQLQNQSYLLSGAHTVENLGSFEAVPYVFARTTRAILPGGASFRVIGMRVQAAESDGSQRDVQSKSGSAPLELRSK